MEFSTSFEIAYDLYARASGIVVFDKCLKSQIRGHSYVFTTLIRIQLYIEMTKPTLIRANQEETITAILV